MNKSLHVFIAALMVLLGAPTQSAADPAKAQWMVAQAGERQRPTCESDKRRLPRGTTVCREGRQLRCGPYGNWVETGKEC
jgi:hypothetical protein